MEKVKNGIVLIQSAAGSEHNPSLWDKNLEYLTGITSRNAVLLLAPKGMIVERRETHNTPEVGRGCRVREILFVEEQTPWEMRIDGERSSIDLIQKKTGTERVYGLSRLDETLQEVLRNEEVLWINKPFISLSQPLSRDMILVNKIRERFFWLDLKNVAPLIHEMRRVKEPFEIDCLKKAFEIHTQIFKKIMKTLKPGVNESMGQAIFEYELRLKANPADLSIFRKEVSDSLDNMAASIIVASGPKATIAHYMENNRIIQDGELVLIDAGVSYKGYSSDITRTFPANGKFTPRQRELYSIVLEAQKEAIRTMKPGSTALKAHKAVYEHFKKHGLETYGYGLCGHPVGLNIHDSNGDFDLPFEPGVVIVIEPFLSIPEEGIGIRIEDGVLITEDGCELLPGPPREIEDIEALCQR